MEALCSFETSVTGKFFFWPNDTVYNRLIINNDSQKHNYICKYNNLPTTCFGLIRPSSGWNTASEENYLFDLNASGKGGRDLGYKYGDR